MEKILDRQEKCQCLWNEVGKKNEVLLTIRVYLHSYSCYLTPKHEKCREIPREVDLKAVEGHPRSSIFVSMESPYVTSY